MADIGVWVDAVVRLIEERRGAQQYWRARVERRGSWTEAARRLVPIYQEMVK